MNRELSLQRAFFIRNEMHLGQRGMLSVRKPCQGSQVVTQDITRRKRTEPGCTARENPFQDRRAHANDLRDSYGVDAG